MECTRQAIAFLLNVLFEMIQIVAAFTEAARDLDLATFGFEVTAQVAHGASVLAIRALVHLVFGKVQRIDGDVGQGLNVLEIFVELCLAAVAHGTFGVSSATESSAWFHFHRTPRVDQLYNARKARQVLAAREHKWTKYFLQANRALEIFFNRRQTFDALFFAELVQWLTLAFSRR